LVAKLGKNYLGCMVAECFGPVVGTCVDLAVGGAKEALGKGDEEGGDGLAIDPEEKEPDRFLIKISDGVEKHPKIGNPFLAYQTWVVRIGNTGGEKKEKLLHQCELLRS